MDPMPVGCLLNSISRYLHLVSCQSIKFAPIQTCVRNMVLVLKLLKPLLDDVVDCKIPSDECLDKECEKLDMAVNEAREFLENWSQKMSKISSVLRCEILSGKIQTSLLQICLILQRLSQSSSATSSVTAVKRCMQEIETMKQERTLTEHIEDALRSQKDDIVPSINHLVNIVQLLGLTSNQDLFKESIAVEKERINAQASKSREKIDRVDQLVNLVSCMREYMLRTELLTVNSGAPVPAYFRCPLSMELMLDPVIVASGQTYDRASIQKWLDQGLAVCPKTRQMLTHNELIPNYTVKAMVASWLEANNIQVAANSGQDDGDALSVANNITSHDFGHTESFRCSLRSSSFTSRSSLEIGNGFEKLKIDVSAGLCGESHYIRSKDIEIFARSSPEQSYTHSRSESISSAVSSLDYVPSLRNEATSIPRNNENFHRMSPKTKSESSSNGNHNYEAANTSVSSEPNLDDSVTTSHVMKLVEDLKSQSNEVKTAAAAELRHLTRNDMENRIVVGRCGAIVPLITLLYSEKRLTQEHAVTAILNLSINQANKAMIAEVGALEPLIHVLNTGNDRAKENSAATLFSLSVLQDYRAKIGRSGAIRALVNLLGTGTLRGKKDAASALFNLSIFHENKARIVQAGAVKYLVELLDPNSEMADKAVALLANLSTVGEGRLAIVKEGGIPLLVETVDTGSHRGKENAASALLQLCLNSPKFCTLVLQEGAIPPLVALSQSGTSRAKEKAQQLLSHFRNQREATMKKARS